MAFISNDMVTINESIKVFRALASPRYESLSKVLRIEVHVKIGIFSYIEINPSVNKVP